VKHCTICGKEFDETQPADSVFLEAGAWLAEEIWKDSGEICPQCLENRARLAMMYAHDCNT
jgi:DNA-directed RNA polymerase subunit RPC12/RpoP